MDNRDKTNKRTSIYDEDTDWLDDEDDYLDDGGLLGSLLFGDKKKKHKEDSAERTVKKKEDAEERPVRRPAGERPVGERPARRPAGERPSGERPARRPAGERPSGERPARRPAGERPSGEQPARRPAGERPSGERPARRPSGERPVRRPAGERPSGERPARRPAGERPMGERPIRRASDGRATDNSVDTLLQEVVNLENDALKRQEQRREAWERTQRNVAKARAEVERLEVERENAEREEARKRRVRQELEMREAEERRLREDMEKADEADSLQDLTGAFVEETADVESVQEEAAVEEAATQERHSDALDMDELERIERDIDEDKLSYSESNTEELALGEIGKLLGFDEVELEDDEEEPEQGESDSEKFFRANLLDEADPKVVNPERKRITLSNRIWGIAFVVLLLLFILVCVIYVKNYARMKYNEMDINEISEDQLLVNEGVKDETQGYRSIALYGVDSRDENTDAGTNSDCIIIVSIDEDTKEIKLVSVYRDTLMQIASGSGVTQKVNYAYQVGGAVTAINTLNTNLDMNITDYVAVDFSAMASIIDAVGGVDVAVTDDEVNSFNKNLAEQISLSGNFSEGITEGGNYTLDGQQAVAYSRIRNTDKGDITRTERQRVVLTKVIEKLLAADTGALQNFVDVSFGFISTSFKKDEIYELVKDASEYSMTDTVGFPFAYSVVSLTDKGNCLAASDMASNVSALHEYLYGNKSYKVSSTALEISNALTKETGVSAQNITVSPENVGDGISGTNKTGGDYKTITEPPAGMTDVE